jgi:hypothetical protein
MTNEIYRDLNGNLFHEDGAELTLLEYKELTALWQAEQVKDGNASWDSDPCNWCGEAVCTCNLNLAAGFDLAPREETRSPRQPRTLPRQGSSYRPERPEWVR